MKKVYSYEYRKSCPLVYALGIVGSKWKIPILWNLTAEDGIHYNELRRRVKGITNTMLAKCLKELEADGLIRRYSYGSVPPSVTYHLTDIGKEVIPSLKGLYDWGNKHKQFCTVAENVAIPCPALEFISGD